MRDEGTLMDYLQDEYNLIYAMLSDGKLSAEEIVTLISDLHTGAVEGVSIVKSSFYFTLISDFNTGAVKVLNVYKVPLFFPEFCFQNYFRSVLIEI